MSYDVLTEKWITVTAEDIGVTNVSPFDILENKIKCLEIIESNPLIEFSIIRFLTILTSDIMQFEDYYEIQDFIKFNNGISLEKLAKYKSNCEKERKGCFDLFNLENAFMQNSYLKIPLNKKNEVDYKNKVIKKITILFPDKVSGESHCHFGWYDDIYTCNNVELLKGLLFSNLYTVSKGGGAYKAGVFNNVNRIYSIISKNSLFETILLNSVDKHHCERNNLNLGKPVWRFDYNDLKVKVQDTLNNHEEIGILTYMLFLNRDIKLLKNVNTHCLFTPSMKLPTHFIKTDKKEYEEYIARTLYEGNEKCVHSQYIQTKENKIIRKTINAKIPYILDADYFTIFNNPNSRMKQQEDTFNIINYWALDGESKFRRWGKDKILFNINISKDEYYNKYVKDFFDLISFNKFKKFISPITVSAKDDKTKEKRTKNLLALYQTFISNINLKISEVLNYANFDKKFIEKEYQNNLKKDIFRIIKQLEEKMLNKRNHSIKDVFTFYKNFNKT